MGCVSDPHPFDVPPDGERAAADRPAVEAEVGRPRRRHSRLVAISVAASVIFTAGAGGGAVASLALARGMTAATVDGGGAGSAPDGFGGGAGGFGRFPPGGRDPSGAASPATAATAAQIAGIVTIVSELGYQNGQAAGTGMLLTSNGRILTNNHVIEGATSIAVEVPSTGGSYSADVVGTDAKRDIAVLQLQNASGLTPVRLATRQPSIGDDVTAVGNANGTGTLSAAAGTVSALGQTITTSSDGSTAGRTLEGLIEISAEVVSGDSGGAVENAEGAVVGVTTAASSGTSAVSGYAIPIDAALGVAKRIVAGDRTGGITLGLPAFLGVALSSDTSGTSGAVVAQVLPGTAAAKTGIAAGDTITAVDRTTITSGADLSKAIAGHRVGDRVRIGYTDAQGGSRTTTVTLLPGPAD